MLTSSTESEEEKEGTGESVFFHVVGSCPPEMIYVGSPAVSCESTRLHRTECRHYGNMAELAI